MKRLLLLSLLALFTAEQLSAGPISSLPTDGAPTGTDMFILEKVGDTKDKKTTRTALRLNLFGTGTSGGFTWVCGTASGDDCTISTTSHATKGNLFIGTSTYDEANNRLGIGTASPAYTLDVTSSTAADVNFQIRNSSATGFSGIGFKDSGGTVVAAVAVDNANSRFRINSTGGNPISVLTNSVEHLRIDTAGHYNTLGTAPSISCTGTGTSPASPTTVGTDEAFIITVNTGTGSPGSTGTCTPTFAVAYTTNAPVMVCTPTKGATDWANGSTVRVTTESASAPVLTWTNIASGTPTALTISTSYKISCIVFGRL